MDCYHELPASAGWDNQLQLESIDGSIGTAAGSGNTNAFAANKLFDFNFPRALLSHERLNQPLPMPTTEISTTSGQLS